MKKSSWGYYGVKLIFQFLITGEPIKERLDTNYSNDSTFFEESVRVVKAQSFEQAYKIAQKQAENDCSSYVNMYGQTVEYNLVDVIDCFEIYEELQAGVEVYSSYTCVSKSVSAKDYLEQKYSYCFNDNEENLKREEQNIAKQAVLRQEEFSKWRKQQN